MDLRFPKRLGCGRQAFTLIEVILAMVIALAILLVLIYFYEQATNLRAQAIQETERISAARLVMNRITTELRAVSGEPGPIQTLTGSSNAIEFVFADVPQTTRWLGGALGRSSFPVTDLKRVRYRLEGGDGTNVAGLLRTEEPAVVRRDLAYDEEEGEAGGTNVVTAYDDPRRPIVEEIRSLQFRYWGGTNWLDAWTGPDLPSGVEVSLGAESNTNATELVEEDPSQFRRIIFLPASLSQDLALTSGMTNGTDTLPPEPP